MANEDKKNIYRQRRGRLKELLREHGLDAMLVTHPANRFYLSGFELHDPQPNESAGRLIITAYGEDWLATDSRYLLAAEKLWKRENIFIYSANVAEELGGLVSTLGSIVGYESRNVSHAFAQGLRAGKSGQFRASFIPANGLVEQLRLIKDESEIAALNASFALNHKMLAWLEQRLKDGSLAGLSEKALAWEIEKFFRENGAQELAFATIAAYASAAAQPHALPGATPLENEMPILVDVGCRVEDYCSDQTRSWWHGTRPTTEFARALELVKAAQQAAFAIMRPGVACADVYKAAREVFAKAGQEKYFNHGLGHGVGLETHEGPSLSSRSTMPLREDMVVTVEPGLYYPEWGGVRWENTVLIEKNGIRLL